MSIEDGYFLARELSAGDVSNADFVRRALQAYEERRKPHTSASKPTGVLYREVISPYAETPAAQAICDLVFDYTPFLQKVIGDETPGHILKQLDEIEHAPLERR